MGKRLFLIGNGFDLAHKLPTRYLDLLKWLYENDKSTFNNLNKLLLGNYDKKRDSRRYKESLSKIEDSIQGIDEDTEKEKGFKILKSFEDPYALYAIWQSLEDYLYLVFLDEEIENAFLERESIRQTLEDEEYGQVTEEDIDVIYRPEQEHLDKLTKLAENFKYDLEHWVDTVNDKIPWIYDIMENKNEHEKKKLALLPDNYFTEDDYIINFNYSNTIEKLYLMDNVFHIHGKDDYYNPPIMGHTDSISQMGIYDERTLVLVDDFYKDFNSIIESNNDYFSKINNVGEIVVLGMGYTETDEIYFKKINKMLPTVKWKLYYYSDEDLRKAKGYVDDIGIESYDYISLKEDSPYTNIVRYDLDD